MLASSRIGRIDPETNNPLTIFISKWKTCYFLSFLNYKCRTNIVVKCESMTEATKRLQRRLRSQSCYFLSFHFEIIVSTSYPFISKSLYLLLILSFRNHCITSYPFISKSLYYFLSFHFEIIVSTSYPLNSKSLLLFKKSIQSRLYHFLTFIFFLWKVFHISLIYCG